jgi:Membrane bound O-acyl transferase family
MLENSAMTTTVLTAEFATHPGRTRHQFGLCFASLLVMLASPWLLPGWASMFVNCGVMFAALKQLAWSAAPNATREATLLEQMAFYLLWPGFDIAASLGGRQIEKRRPTGAAWLAATANTCTAIGILWCALPLLRNLDPLLLGAAGMLSGVLLIHCGLFHFVALAWQLAGRRVRPIMNQPLAATSPVDFWSRRWNLAFRDAIALIFFRPLARTYGPRVAAFATFILSGLMHEAVISLPARGGYGLPTLYFTVQGIAAGLERRWKHQTSTRCGTILSRITTAAVVIVPLPLLFPPPFAEHVMMPFLRTLRVL